MSTVPGTLTYEGIQYDGTNFAEFAAELPESWSREVTDEDEAAPYGGAPVCAIRLAGRWTYLSVGDWMVLQPDGTQSMARAGRFVPDE